MQSKFHQSAARLSAKRLRLVSMTLMVSLSFFTTGCLSSLAKHSNALSAAMAPAVDEAAAAYRDAEALYDLRVDYDAVSQFDVNQPVYNPRNFQPLMSDKDIQTRLAVLAALQTYAKSLVAITGGTDSPALEAASKSVGGDLSSLGNSLAPSVESTLGITTASSSTTDTIVTTVSGPTATTTLSTSSATTPLITPEIQNGISTAVDALGQFLVGNKIKKELPQKIIAMDPHIQALCNLLEQDIDTLQNQDDRDYNRVINLETLFIRQNASLNPEQRRADIMKLPEIVRQQRAADQKLAELRSAIARLAFTHHALAADAQGKTMESLTDKLKELEVAGESLGKFYSSLPTN